MKRLVIAWWFMVLRYDFWIRGPWVGDERCSMDYCVQKYGCSNDIQRTRDLFKIYCYIGGKNGCSLKARDVRVIVQCDHYHPRTVAHVWFCFWSERRLAIGEKKVDVMFSWWKRGSCKPDEASSHQTPRSICRDQHRSWEKKTIGLR